jgi:hypothetical protein
MLFALIILVLGIIFLLRNLGIIGVDIWPVIWPSLLIVIALRMIIRARRRWTIWSDFGRTIRDVKREMDETE